MNKYSTIFLLILFMLLVVLGCNADVIDTPEYNGKELTIGVIGEPPEIREENVNFERVTFDQLKKLESPSEYDAVFITQEHLSEAANQEYARIYKSSDIPFFFIESKKSYLPFTQEEMTYEDVPDISTDTYATGYYQFGDKFQYWGYGLYNDKLNNSNIMDVYTRIFSTVESLVAERK